MNEIDDHNEWLYSHVKVSTSTRRHSSGLGFGGMRIREEVGVKLRFFLDRWVEQEREEQRMLGFDYGSDHVTSMSPGTVVIVCDVYRAKGVEAVEGMELKTPRVVLEFLRTSERESLAVQTKPPSLTLVDSLDPGTMGIERFGRRTGKKLRLLSTAHKSRRGIVVGSSLSLESRRGTTSDTEIEAPIESSIADVDMERETAAVGATPRVFHQEFLQLYMESPRSDQDAVFKLYLLDSQ